MKISFQQDCIKIETNKKIYYLTNLKEIYSLHKHLKNCQINSKNEQVSRRLTMTLDMLNSAKHMFIQFHETKCFENFLYPSKHFDLS